MVALLTLTIVWIHTESLIKHGGQKARRSPKNLRHSEQHVLDILLAS